MGKGSRRRLSQISREREEVQWAYFEGKINRTTYEHRKKKLIKEGKWFPK